MKQIQSKKRLGRDAEQVHSVEPRHAVQALAQARDPRPEAKDRQRERPSDVEESLAHLRVLEIRRELTRPEEDPGDCEEDGEQIPGEAKYASGNPIRANPKSSKYQVRSVVMCVKRISVTECPFRNGVRGMQKSDPPPGTP